MIWVDVLGPWTHRGVVAYEDVWGGTLAAGDNLGDPPPPPPHPHIYHHIDRCSLCGVRLSGDTDVGMIPGLFISPVSCGDSSTGIIYPKYRYYPHVSCHYITVFEVYANYSPGL